MRDLGSDPELGGVMGTRLGDLRQYDGKVATVVWRHPDEGWQATRGRVRVHRGNQASRGAVELYDPDSGALRLSLAWQRVTRVEDAYEDLRDAGTLRHLKLDRVGAGRDGAEIYMAAEGRWRIIQGWDGICADARVWHIYETPPKVSRFITTAGSLTSAVEWINREESRRPEGRSDRAGPRRDPRRGRSDEHATGRPATV
jgi:hypothetical protein